MEVLLVVLVLLTFAVLCALLVLLSRKPREAVSVPIPANDLTQAVYEGQRQVGMLGQHLSGTMAQLLDRVRAVEDWQRVSGERMYTDMGHSHMVSTEVLDTARGLRSELARAQESLAELREATRRHEGTHEAIQRMRLVMAGSRSIGKAGENVLETLFTQLPPEWQVRNHMINNHYVEFALRLPDTRLLPIDSKWVATNLLEDFHNCKDEATKRHLRREIEDTVVNRGKEIRKYLDPHSTVDFGVAVVPDAVFHLCDGIHGKMFKNNVMVISHTMFLPYLLLVYQMASKSLSTLDMKRLDSQVSAIQADLSILQGVVEGRLSKAIVMLGNSRSELARVITKAQDRAVSLRMATDESGGPPGTPIELNDEIDLLA